MLRSLERDAMDLFDEFRILVGRLEAAQLDYAVAGGLAVAIYGAPRATTDIDLVIHAHDLENIGREAATIGCSFAALPMEFQSGIVVHRRTKFADGETLTLDLMLAKGPIAGVLETKERRATDFGPIWVVSRVALVAMKTLAARPLDLDDIRRLNEQDG